MPRPIRTARAAAGRVLLSAALATGAPASGGHALGSGELLTTGQSLRSENGRFRLDLTEDGRLIVRERLPADGWQPRWRSWLYQAALGRATLQMRSDNKLLIHDTVPWLDQPLLIWESCNVRLAPEGTGTLVLGDDGSLAILAGGKRTWEAEQEEQGCASPTP